MQLVRKRNKLKLQSFSFYEFLNERECCRREFSVGI
jgi:hypothetical protein